MRPPRISVLIPAYNRQDTIRQCLDSVLANRYQDMEIIISDNGSSDGTAEIVAGYLPLDSRIRLIRHASNLGPLPNWKSCLDAASGGHIHWLWSDDWVEPNFYQTLMDGLERHQAQVAIAAARIINPAENWWFIAHSHPNCLIPKAQWMRLMLAGSVGPCSPAAALLPTESCRRHFTDRIPVRGGIDCNRRAIGCDALMIIGAIHDGTMVYSHPDPLVNFRVHGGSITISSGMDVTRIHYAWARLCWRKQHGYPRSSVGRDVLRLLAARQYMAALRGIW